MYKIIGADGREYGPITADQLKQWIAEKRANGQTQVQPEGATGWQALGSLPEFAEMLADKIPPSLNPTPAPLAASYTAPAGDRITGPAIGLIVTAILGFIANAIGAVSVLAGGMFNHPPPGMDPEVQKMIQMFSGSIGVISCVVGVIFSAVVLFGAIKMKNLSSYAWAMTAAIIALFPCTSPCCLVGLPIGIWALVVLLKPEVKAAFH